jgi:hypothetical protein
MDLDFVSFVFDWREDVLEELEGMFEIKIIILCLTFKILRI